MKETTTGSPSPNRGSFQDISLRAHHLRHVRLLQQGRQPETIAGQTMEAYGVLR